MPHCIKRLHRSKNFSVKKDLNGFKPRNAPSVRQTVLVFIGFLYHCNSIAQNGYFKDFPSRERGFDSRLPAFVGGSQEVRHRLSKKPVLVFICLHLTSFRIGGAYNGYFNLQKKISG
jgi:hypothetical protein